MKYTRTTPPTVEPVTLSQVKRHLRLAVKGSEAIYASEDDELSALIQMAREQVEHHTRRSLLTQTWTVNLDNWPKGKEIELPFPPLISVTHVKYTDTDDSQSTFTDYSVSAGSPGRVVLDYGETWPGDTLNPVDPIEIQYVAGYGATAADVPASIKQAMLLVIGHLYENRERVVYTSIGELPFAVDSLLASYRWF